MTSPHKLMASLCLSLSLLLTACGGGDGTPRPVADAGADQTVDIGTTVVLDGSASHAPDAEATLQYAWTLVEKPEGSAAELSDPNAVQPSFLVDLPGAYEADLQVSDGTADSGHDRVRIAARNPDPQAMAASEHNVLIGTTVMLDGSASLPPTDADPAQLRYEWSLTEKPLGSLAELSEAESATASFYADREGRYAATLVVAHGDKRSAPLPVDITASISNTRPVADAGGPYEIERGQTLTLDGSGSSDADGDDLSYHWYMYLPSNDTGYGHVGIPRGSALRMENALANPDTVNPILTPDVAGRWMVYLAVYDGTSLSNFSSTRIEVRKPDDAGNTPPVATFYTPSAVSFAEAVYSDEVELGGAVWSSGASYDIDDERPTRRYRWIETPTGFDAPDLTGATSFSFTPTVEGDYTVEMIVNDGVMDSAPTQRTFTARTGANSSPRATVTLDSRTVMLSDTAWFDGSTSTDPEGDALTYQWVLVDQPKDSDATLQLSNVTREDGTVLVGARASIVTDAPGTYIAMLVVTDSHGVTSSTTGPAYGRVFVKSENNPPVIGYISNNNTHHPSRRTNMHFDSADQPYVIGGAPMMLYAVNVVDPDLDPLYYLWTLTQPAGSTLEEAVTTQDFRIGQPLVAGTYTANAVASDGVVRSEPHELGFDAVQRADYPSLLLEDLHDVEINYGDRYLRDSFDAPYQRAFPYWFRDNGSHPIFVRMFEPGDNVVKRYRLTAFGGDYTIRNLAVAASTNLDYPGYAGKFVGLSEGQVIAQGESVTFTLQVNAPGGQGTTTPSNNVLDGMRFSFDVAEKPGWRFEYWPYSY